jgi:hypothetical protein
MREMKKDKTCFLHPSFFRTTAFGVGILRFALTYRSFLR